eukprot:3905485-Pyramimonas_sp.AAC.3
MAQYYCAVVGVTSISSSPVQALLSAPRTGPQQPQQRRALLSAAGSSQRRNTLSPTLLWARSSTRSRSSDNCQQTTRRQLAVKATGIQENESMEVRM